MGNFTSDYIDIAMLVSFVINIILLAVNIHFRQSNEEKDIKLIQFYLDLKFIHQQISEFNFLGSHQKFAAQLKKNMQDYYNLEDVIVIDSVQMAKTEKNNFFRAAVIDALQEGIDEIIELLEKKKYIVKPIRVGSYKLRLYVFKLLEGSNSDGLIICCEKIPSLLGKEERKSLQNTVNLLRAMLISS